MRYWFKNGAKTDKGMYHIDCYQCVNVCSFNKKPGIGHDMIRWSIRRLPALDRFWVFADDLLYKPIFPTGIHKIKGACDEDA